jgi:diguanylate cyclase (GGDEF)-like protein
VRIEEFLAGGVRVSTAPGATLQPGTRDVEIRYTALSFLAPDRVFFRYKLEGYDEQWVEAGTRRTAYYTALPPRRYRFRVEACNNDGVWNRAGAGFEFRLRPRLYQTWPFRAAVLLGILLAGYGLFRARVAALKVRQAQLEAVVEQRTGELRRANLELEHRAGMDSLTGLANHGTFHEKLDEEWRRCLRKESPLSLVFIDIDHFKLYNDAHGHPEGDGCLRRVADAIAAQVRRPTDLTARYGGEEFAVVLSETPDEGALYVAETQRAAVEDLAIHHGASPVSPVVTISLGVATATPTKDESPEELLARADAALYRAKAAGRNRVVVAQTAPDSEERQEVLE